MKFGMSLMFQRWQLYSKRLEDVQKHAIICMTALSVFPATLLSNTLLHFNHSLQLYFGILFDSIRFSSKCFKIKALLEDEEEFRNDPWIDENKKLKMWCQNKNLTETVTEI